MKRILILLLLAMPMVGFAQDEKTADDYKNEGNEYLRNKNNQDALTSYQKAIELWGDSLDKATVYNAATCAKAIQDYETSLTYYNKSIELGYKADYSLYYIAEIYGKQGKTEERIAKLEEGYELYKEGKVASFIQKGLSKEYVNKANTYYKEGNTILQEAQTAKPEQYADIEARAKVKFQESEVWVEKALEVNPTDTNATNMKAALAKVL